MSGSTAARHDGVMASATAAESEPLFSADDEGYDIGQSESSNASKQNGHNSMTDPSVQGNVASSHYPPPKYLKSTFTSREYEYDASDDIIEPEAEDGTRDDLPVMTGLLQTARSRGSVEVHRRRSSSASGDGLSPEDAALENGLIVGIGAAGGGILASVSNMSNSIIGAGIIGKPNSTRRRVCLDASESGVHCDNSTGLPYAIREAGFFTGIALLVGLGMITDWTIRLIVVNAKLTGQKTYSDIMEACFGFKGRAAVAFIQFAMAFGGMCAFAVILGDTIPHVLTSLMPGFAATGAGGWLLSRQIVTIMSTLLISYPLSLYRDIDKLSKASALALVSMCIIIVTVLIEGPSLPAELKGTETPFTIIDSGFFEAVGVISFAYVCHHNTLLIYGSLVTPTIDRWNKVTHISMAISVAASLVMATSGYFIFTDKTRGNILNNFPSDHFWANVARLCFGLNMMTTTPLEAFVCREVFESFFYQDQAFNQRRHVIVTTALIAASLLVSLFTCDLGLVLELTGGFSATCLAFIFPAACSLHLSNEPFARSKWLTWACMVFGIVVCVLATSLSLIKSGSKPHKVC